MVGCPTNDKQRQTKTIQQLGIRIKSLQQLAYSLKHWTSTMRQWGVSASILILQPDTSDLCCHDARRFITLSLKGQYIYSLIILIHSAVLSTPSFQFVFVFFVLFWVAGGPVCCQACCSAVVVLRYNFMRVVNQLQSCNIDVSIAAFA